MVGYLFGIERYDIKIAINEITEDISVLESIAPTDLVNHTPERRAALIEFGKNRRAITTHQVALKETCEGYIFFFTWLKCLYDHAEYTGQLTE